VQANAESIADYLRIRSGDRAATTLPMHYCYGLSVINSHLLRGAGLILTDLSVVDTCFWDLFRTKRGTTFAGVPYTFELLDRVDFAAMQLRDLRYVTQAGGRLAPDLVRRYAQLGEPTTDLRALYAEILGRSDVTDDSTFVSLGGDSLSYVEISLRLEQALGHLPAGWHTMPIRDLVPADPPRFKRGHALDTSIALRAIAIVLVVGTHAQLFTIRGGAHLLLGIAGFNFARFHLTSAERGERARRLLSTITRIAAASMTWIALACLLAPNDYGLANIFLLNGLLGPDEVGSEWRYWFIEALVAILLVLTVLLSIPLVDKIERRAPFALPLALMTLGLATRFKLVVIDIGGVDRFTPHVVFWLFALGWAAAKAASGWQRWCVTLAVVATVPGFFGAPLRETIVIGGLLLLVWVPSVRAPGLVSRSAAVLAGSSLYIYLTHWHIYIQIRDYSPLVAVLASLLFGVLYAKTVPGATAVLSSVSRRLAAHVSPRRLSAPGLCGIRRA